LDADYFAGFDLRQQRNGTRLQPHRFSADAPFWEKKWAKAFLFLMALGVMALLALSAFIIHL
jgi:hypothetical protein